MNAQGPREVLNVLEPSTQEIHGQYEYNLMEQVVERSNLKKALKRVEKNKGAPGIDGMKTDELLEHLQENWETLKQQLLKGSYKPLPVRRFEIPKSGGGKRPLGIPTVVDRFIQQAIMQVLTPIFEPEFSDSSYGFRPERSARQAVIQAKEYIKQGNDTVVDIDLEKFFDRVNHDILMQKIMQKIQDKRMIRIIRRYLESGVMITGCYVKTEKGTPQGGPLSPLLANIMLNDLDKELERRGHMFVRYADDCNIYVKSERAGKRVFVSIKKFLETHLKLNINLEKSAIDRPWKRKFLGFSFYKMKTTGICLAPQTIARFKEDIRKQTRRTASVSMETRIKQINAKLIGWVNYFSIAECKGLLEELDAWIRRRLRMCLLKQWKQCTTKLRNLKRLGIEEKWAGRIAFSRKKYWRLANTPQINKALGHAYWQEQGLVSLLNKYLEIRVVI